MNPEETKRGDMHPLDKEYFDKHPAKLFEMLVQNHYVQINHTTPFYGILLYSIVKAIQAFNVIEIGVGYGWCSYFMAQAVKENVARHPEMKGRYLALDNSDRTKNLFNKMRDDGLPVEYIYKNSLEMKPEELIFNDRGIDLVFQDGNHEKEHCLKELDILYPLLKDKGDGYLVCHDTYAWCEEYFKAIYKNPKYKWEFVSFPYNMGITIFRKMENYSYDEIRWPLTDEDRKKVVW